LTDYDNYEVIVVDNGSTDGSTEHAEARLQNLDVLSLGRNYGYARGNNQGIKYALAKHGPSYILLLNNDTRIVQNDWLSRMIRTAETDRSIAVVGPKLMYPDGAAQFYAGYFTPLERVFYWGNETRQVEWVSGACFMIRTDVLMRLGAFDERYSPYFYEETEYCARCSKKGYKVLTVPSAKLVHFGQQSLRRVEDSEAIYNWCKNEILFFLTNLPRSYLVSVLRKDLGEAASKKQFAATMRGYLDGYRLSRREPLIWRPPSAIDVFPEVTDLSQPEAEQRASRLRYGAERPRTS